MCFISCITLKMEDKTMGKPVFLDPIDYISGKISRKYRTIYARRKDNDRRYTQVHGNRTTQPGTKELKARERFAGVAQMVTARRADLTKIVADQQAFLAQKDTAGGAKTMRAYLWRVCGQEYDAEHQG